MPPWLQWIIDLIFGGKKQSQTDQQLGRVEQQRDNETAVHEATVKEEERAKQIDEDVHHESDAALDAELQQPSPPGGGVKGSAGPGGL